MVEEYNQREKEIKEMEKELDEKTKALNTYRQNISEARFSSSTPHTGARDCITHFILFFFPGEGALVDSPEAVGGSD